MSTPTTKQEESGKISTVIPVFNEAESVTELHERLVKTLQETRLPFEIIFVDDGSKDGTAEVLKQLSPVTIVRFPRNFGKAQATMAGLRESTGSVIITMDGDLENLPEDIPLFIEKLKEGYDVVSGWRTARWKGQFFTRKLPSVSANWLISTITGVHLHDHGGFFKAYRREAAMSLPFLGDIHRLMPAYAAQSGAKVVEIPIGFEKRRYGKSKYGLMRTFKVLLDVITFHFFQKYGKNPMHFFGVAGFFSFFLGSLVSLWMVWLKIVEGLKFTQSPLPVVAIFFFMIAFQFILMGLLAEMLHRLSSSTSPGGTLPIIAERIKK